MSGGSAVGGAAVAGWVPNSRPHNRIAVVSVALVIVFLLADGCVAR
jgi:hypothetical protein